jgi:hypothetical protein
MRSMGQSEATAHHGIRYSAHQAMGWRFALAHPTATLVGNAHPRDLRHSQKSRIYVVFAEPFA